MADKNGQHRGGNRGGLPSQSRPSVRKNDVGYAKALFMLPGIDMKDPDAVMGRYFELLDLCERYDRAMTIEAICMGFDTTRDEIVRMGRGEKTRLGLRLSPESGEAFQKVLKSVAGIWAAHMSSGDFKQPVAGIFIGKNNFGYGDETVTVVRHEDTRLGPSREELAAKYQAAIPAENPVVIEGASTYDLPAEKPRKKPGPKPKQSAQAKASQKKRATKKRSSPANSAK